MASLAEFRAQYPQYADVPDAKLAVSLHRKFYSDMPIVDYIGKLGLDRQALIGRTGSPEDDQYLMQQLERPGANETPEQAAARYGGVIKNREPNFIENAMRSLFQGQTFGWGDEAVAGVAAALNPDQSKSFGDKFDTYLSREQGRIDQFRKDNPVAAFGTELGGSIPTALLTTPGVVGQGATMGARALGGLVTGGLQGAVYGAGSAEGGLGERAAGAGIGAATGGAIGAAAPYVAAGVRKLITPAPAQASKLAAAKVLQKEGVELTAGQTTGNRNLQFREAELGGNAARDFMDRQAEQFTQAALRRVGVTAGRATPDVVDNAFASIGQQFDDLAARNSIVPDMRLARDMSAAWRRFEDVTNPSTRPKIVERLIKDIFTDPRSPIPGQWYTATRSELGRITRGSSVPELVEAAKDLQSALDAAMERTIAKANPADLGAFKEARRLYRNMLVIEDATGRAGADAADGLISPAALRSAAMRQNKRAFIRGQSEFTDLANAGVSTMTKLPDSGTKGRLNASTILPLGAATGAGIGGGVAGPIGAIVGAAGGAAVPAIAGRAMLSKAGRAYLSNQVWNKPPNGGLLEQILRGSRLPAFTAEGAKDGKGTVKILSITPHQGSY